jgi:uncharacterized membrane protein YphA (DoxX/SURF4 family)
MIHRLVYWFIEPPDEAPPFAAAILDRFPVGTIFLIEGILKFRSPQEFGVGRFIRIGIPLPHFFAPFDGVFEIGCGALLLLGLFTRLAVIPMIINMCVAIYTTKLPVLTKEDFWKMANCEGLKIQPSFCNFLSERASHVCCKSHLSARETQVREGEVDGTSCND